MARLLYLEGDDPDEPIELRINSPGGGPERLAIVDTIAQLTCPVATVCAGMAASMASVLLASGTRAAGGPPPTPGADPKPWAGQFQGQATDLERAAEEILRQRARIDQLWPTPPASRSSASTATPSATPGSRPPRPASTAWSTRLRASEAARGGGEAPRRRRQHQRPHLREVAEAAGVSLTYLSEVERGRKEASSEVLEAVCAALRLGLAELFFEVAETLALAEAVVGVSGGDAGGGAPAVVRFPGPLPAPRAAAAPGRPRRWPRSWTCARLRRPRHTA